MSRYLVDLLRKTGIAEQLADDIDIVVSNDVVSTAAAADEFAQAFAFPLAKRRAWERETNPWLGDPAFHRSHRSGLLRKDPAHYRPIFGDVPDDLPYVWPASDRQRRVLER